jgi:exopolysaccharide biosynthesis protein
VLRVKAALLFLAVAVTAHADWTIRSAHSEPERAGVVHRQISLEDSETNESATIDLALFSTKSCTLRVIDQPAPPRSELAHVMRQERCLAGINGGYFDPDYGPIGLLISDGKMIAPLRRAKLITGVLAASRRKVQILRTREFSQHQEFTAAVQSGPFLVDLGRTVRGLETTRTARRTFAAVGNVNRAALGFCSGVSLSELAKILATTRLAEDFRIERALNLDGGSSSAFWVARENGSAFSIPEQKTVRDFVGVAPK